MTTIKPVCFPDNDDTKRLLNNISKIRKATGKSFSEISRQALYAYVDKEIRLVQSRLDTFQDPFEETLDKLHREFVEDNREQHPTWVHCLQAKKIYSQRAVEYSIQKGWHVE